ncbi:hypothetical protein L6164_036055 [Bauhinia variegata]|uniref:Uncharacterized protein n=1 Tax=Bauhinia variegata TaxID=167791 RepID=A0ACB9KFT4_BAUVA|nr:hypothetical protein L6164_036055 [Bauhinia variegata]
MSEETGECLDYECDEEISSCTCIGFKKNQVFDYSYETTEELFEINLNKLPLDTIREDCESSVFSLDFHSGKDSVYVAVGDGESSMDALSWALNHVVTPSTSVILVHVFPVIKLIPSPLGKIPRIHVSPEYINMYLTQEKGKRKVLLKKLIDLCLASEVKVEMMLIEGDNVAKAIVDLVTNLDIRKLFIGTTKSNLSKTGSRRRSTIAGKVLKNAPETCDVKIICEGKEVIDQVINLASASTRSSDSSSSKSSQEEDKVGGLVPFMRFFPKSTWLFRPRFL